MKNHERGPMVLVTAGSKHGATAEMATRIAARLAAAGLTCDDRDPADVEDVSKYDAFVIGSAVYAGRWTDSAKKVAHRVASLPGDPPVWLFSSGPIGDPPKPEEDPVDVAEIAAATNPRDHAIFAGKVDKSLLNFGERAILVAVRAPEGDFRDWAEIEGWADGIANELALEDTSAPSPTEPIGVT